MNTRMKITYMMTNFFRELLSLNLYDYIKISKGNTRNVKEEYPVLVIHQNLIVKIFKMHLLL